MFAILFLLFVLAAGKLEALEISCNQVNGTALGSSCFFASTAVISEKNISLADLGNFSVDAIMFADNKKIEFLPVNVYKQCPITQFFVARNLSLKEISATNFERLTSLHFLDLSTNLIRFIPNFCFEGLIKLKHIILSTNHLIIKLQFVYYFCHTGDNEIETMNGIAFANLPRLSSADLTGNVCVNQIFITQPFASIFRRIVSRNCASRNEISCKILDFCEDDRLFNRTAGCCQLDYGTYIDSPDYSFMANEDYAVLEAILVEYQGSMQFLPVFLHDTFPMLKVYSVIHTPARKITKKNFEKLFKLEKLRLQNNYIEAIQSNTFEDLISLQVLEISKNLLKVLKNFIVTIF